MQSQELKKYRIPDKPGVYFFLDKKKKPIYIGKATSLKDRVKSYFSRELFNMRGPLLVDMVTKTTDIKWQETDSVLEALILEANLIKKHQPIYNTKEKSDKSFNYVCITKEDLPKVIIVRGRNIENNKSLYISIFGPYPNGGQLKEALKIVRRIFPFLDDKSKSNYEFYKQIGLVPPLLNKEGNEGRFLKNSPHPNPLLGKERGQTYFNNIKNIRLFFEGKKQRIFKNLEKEMKILAKNNRFEDANEIKKQLFALKHINDVALIKNDSLGSPATKLRVEAYDIAHMSGKDMVGVMVVIEDGEVNKKEYRKFKIKNYSSSNDVGALREVLDRRFTHTEWQYPKLMVIDGGKAQINAVKKFQNEVGLAIPVVSVVKDERHRPKGILGSYPKEIESQILLANFEAHRFAITYHRKIRGKII